MSIMNDWLHKYGSYGKNPDGSITRTGGTPIYYEVVQALRAEMDKLGMQTDVDAVGNLHGYLPGSDKNAKSIVIGSHLDTVISGGMFDGMLGVIGGMEVVRRLRESKTVLRHPVEVFGFDLEESSPLGGTFGSWCVTGMVDTSTEDFEKNLQSYGWNLQDVASAKRDISKFGCYLEYHIEQGDYLDSHKLDIGAVSGIVGIVRYTVRAFGSSNHAGTTMMDNRRDALVAMCRLILASEKKAREMSDTLVFTVGKISVLPGAENVIPGECEATFEFRHMDKAVTDEFFAAIQAMAAEIKECEFTFTDNCAQYATPCDPELIKTIDAVAGEMGASHVVMPSGAGHDANAMAHSGVPIGMIFVPSVAGISHHGKEWTDERHVDMGAEVLYRTVLAIDKKDF